MPKPEQFDANARLRNVAQRLTNLATQVEHHGYPDATGLHCTIQTVENATSSAEEAINHRNVLAARDKLDATIASARDAIYAYGETKEQRT